MNCLLVVKPLLPVEYWTLNSFNKSFQTVRRSPVPFKFIHTFTVVLNIFAHNLV